MTNKFVKDPDAVLDYIVDWTEWLGTDTIFTSAWILPSALTRVSDSNTETTATVFISGGVVGQTYTAVNRIVTVMGRTDDRSIRVRIAEK